MQTGQRHVRRIADVLPGVGRPGGYYSVQLGFDNRVEFLEPVVGLMGCELSGTGGTTRVALGACKTKLSQLQPVLASIDRGV
jgi:hypothetical protein